jgi:hypothetical protein
MQLRTAYCLNALFQRHDCNRILNVQQSRIDVLPGLSPQTRIIVGTPGEAARRLGQFLENSSLVFRNDSQVRDSGAQAPVEFSIGGMIHDRMTRAEHLVEALNLKFFDLRSPSALTINECFLKGLVHCDAMPDPHGPDIGNFAALLRRAGDNWAALDFLSHLARQHAA